MNNLYRSSDEKVIAGVCAGIAHKLDLNVTGLRWVVALTTLFLSSIGISCTMGCLEGAVNKCRCGGYRLKTNRSLSEIGCAYSFRMKNSPNG